MARAHRLYNEGVRRAGRILVKILSAISLLLCVATCVLWVLSYWIENGIDRVGAAKVICVNSNVGSLHASLTNADPENEKPGPRPYYNLHFTESSKGSRSVMVGNQIVRLWGTIDLTSGYGWIVVPHWLVALLLSVAPLQWAWTQRRTRRRAVQGLCPKCGYDLRESPERCPECGLAVLPK